ncbi:DUF2945 domain-containing protein [Pseudomonas marginalis]
MAPGKGPGNWEGTLGVGDDGSVTVGLWQAHKPGGLADFRFEMS